MSKGDRPSTRSTQLREGSGLQRVFRHNLGAGNFYNVMCLDILISKCFFLFHQHKKLKTKCTVNIIQDTDCEEYNSDSLGHPDMVQAGPYMPVAHCVNVPSH